MIEHRTWLTGSEIGRARRKQRLSEALHNQLRNALIDAAEARMGDAIAEAIEAVEQRAIDPYTASEQLVERFRNG